MIIEIISSFFVALSFGILFNIKGKYLIVAGVGGAITWFIYKLCLGYEFGESSSLFIAALVFSIYCEFAARIYKTPSTILSVCCLIPLVPGYGVYNTMYSLLVGDYIKAMEYGTSTLSSAGALALGVIFVSTLFRNFNLHRLIDKIINYYHRHNNKDIKSSKGYSI
ncbi:threonine/serine exporter [Romboutsia weinsteinii]|uniref:Threonine/serine exporter n=1 Tax=Romboutsia weinsteinii TaxID=2020949 RepID=A0A371J191_9FIRM|nr:threonine/serine exporter family protein [Romboutsia weinsteinii]RDY26464.1 threonine/serine exporter [Romboutsia weinsteinii]